MANQGFERDIEILAHGIEELIFTIAKYKRSIVELVVLKDIAVV